MCLRCSNRVIEHAIADAKLVELARERAKRIEERAKQTRNVALQIIKALGVSPLKRPVYTASVSYHRKLGSLDRSTLPAEFWRHAPEQGGDHQSPARRQGNPRRLARQQPTEI